MQRNSVKWMLFSAIAVALSLFSNGSSVTAQNVIEITWVDAAGGGNFQEFHTTWTAPEINRLLGPSGIRVQYVSVAQRGAELLERVKAEGGDLQVILWKNSDMANALTDPDLGPDAFETLTTANVPNAGLISEGDKVSVLGVPLQDRGLQFWRDQFSFMFNTKFVAKEDAPKSYADFFDRRQQFCGKIGLIAPDAGSGGGRIFIYDFFRANGVNWNQDFDTIFNSPEFQAAKAKWNTFTECIFEDLATGGGNLFEQFLREDIVVSEYATDFLLWSRDRGNAPATMATAVPSDSGIFGGSTLLVVPSAVPDSEKAAAFQVVNFLLSDYVQLTMFAKMFQYPGTNAIDRAPKELFDVVAPLGATNRIGIENSDGFNWIKQNCTLPRGACP